MVYDSKNLSDEQLSALSDPTRLKIMRELSRSPSYPAELAESFGCSKQKLYHHFKILEDSGLIEEERREQISGGEAVYHRPTSKTYSVILTEAEEMPIPEFSANVARFLSPLIKDKKLEGRIVAGSPDEHGPDQVWARDGHLASIIAFKLGNYSRGKEVISLDTEVVDEKLLDETMVLVGGVLTNVVSKKFNESFPAYFPGEEFPYRRLETPENVYRSEDIGVIAKTPNPKSRDEALFLVAGVQEKGTRAAVKAFQDLEQVIGDYRGGRFYAVVKGLDLNSDGKIDDYKVVEKND